MVMPCSRSACRPSTSKARSGTSPVVPQRRLSFATAESWSSNTWRVSCSRRPISVLLPSSTLPQVMKRSRSISRCCARNCSSVRGGSAGLLAAGFTREAAISEIPFALAIFHRSGGLGVDGAALTLRGRGAQHLFDDLGDVRGLGHLRARQRITAERAEANGLEVRLLAVLQRQTIVVDHDLEAVAIHDWTRLGKIQ